MAVKKRKNQTSKRKKSDTTNSSNSTATTTFQDKPNSPKQSPLPMVATFLVLVAAVFFGMRLVANPSDVLAEVRIKSESSANTKLSEWNTFDGIATVTKSYKVLKVTDHDPSAFTQGLQVYNNQIVESTGLYGESLIRIWDPDAGTVIKETLLEKQYFGEGLTYYQDEGGIGRYILLTWKEKTAFIYDIDLNLLDSFQYQTETDEGWGITFDPLEQLFYVSDGSAYIHVWNLKFQEIRKFVVSYELPQVSGTGKDLKHLNELEWDPSDGTVLANVWYQNILVRIWPKTGQVVQIYDLSDLYTNRSPKADCLNGIAHQGGNRWWITGKLWPHLYLIELLD